MTLSLELKTTPAPRLAQTPVSWVCPAAGLRIAIEPERDWPASLDGESAYGGVTVQGPPFCSRWASLYALRLRVDHTEVDSGALVSQRHRRAASPGGDGSGPAGGGAR